MQINGKVVDVEFNVDVAKKDGGTYVGTTLTYKDGQGKVNAKSWVAKALDHAASAKVKAALQTLSKGDNFVAEAVKNDAGFWNWVDLKKSVGTQQAPASTQQAAPRSTWQGETPEERAERRALDKEKFAFEKEKQKLIIRQSSLSNAIAYMKDDRALPDYSVEQAIAVAKQFEAYVLGNYQGSTLADLEDDIPF